MAASPGTVLITGAARRIGRAIALELARAGWAVAVHYHRSAEDAESLAREIAASGGRATALAAALTDESAVQALVPRAAAALGPVTCLVNNASAFEPDTIATVTRASWDTHMETNLRAPLVLTQAFARALPSGAAGNVINILDQRVWNPTPYFLSYTVGKAGLWMLTKTLALALAPAIRVNAIGPGPTLPSERQSAEHFARQQRNTPLGRGPQPEEIGRAARFILDSPSLTGQMIALDGGQHLGWATPESGAPGPNE
jgi:NAD(P)-dependent dehydrogenase (short-subunit alcohol dehydrogenase family)